MNYRQPSWKPRSSAPNIRSQAVNSMHQVLASRSSIPKSATRVSKRNHHRESVAVRVATFPGSDVTNAPAGFTVCVLASIRMHPTTSVTIVRSHLDRRYTLSFMCRPTIMNWLLYLVISVCVVFGVDVW